MKLVVQVKLLPDAATAEALRETLKLCNRAAGHASRRAHATGVTGKTALQRLVYGELKAMGLSAQPAIHCVRKVAGAYATLAQNLKAGNYGPPGSRRRARVENAPVRFRKDAAQPFDDRSLSWRIQERTVSIWTVRGRLKDLAFACSAEQAAMLAAYRRGESDLVWRGGCFYLYATCEVPPAEQYVPDGFTGVDLGIANIATTSDGTVHCGKHINQVRHRNRRLRRRLQGKGTKSAKRLLRHLSGREARFAADTNHRISKQIVTEAQRTTRGIALEDLGGIRARVRLRKPQRVTLHAWSFAQLGAFIAYKAERAGVPVVHVDPRHTSQGCSACGHIDKNNRPDQATFRCTSCGFAEHADVNAARNIAARGAAGWAVSHAADDAA
ncbi:RNA-guided endonuclease TnpB family protein [Actinomadura sp. 7K507]|uniref:RNA-guided endonuclease InsQ/TnpB family protein n=1 Tax=Actinomadura sp. 7K507 TaxID=2530365 RepID=UPI00104F1C93|nr:RNA-guided endonuclease TnpB family protein [Actinomadura sp. 7K507]TDC97810.1 transposase [Actinomadura sp. 7K507]